MSWFVSDKQRRAAFASMGSSFSFAAKPRVAVPIRENFAVLGNALAYKGEAELGGDVYEISSPNIFKETVHGLEDMAKFRGSDIAKVADDVLAMRREQRLLPEDQTIVDVADLPSLQELGYADVFEGETFESMQAGLPAGVETVEDVFAAERRLALGGLPGKEIIVEKEIVDREVPSGIMLVDGGEVVVEPTESVQYPVATRVISDVGDVLPEFDGTEVEGDYRVVVDDGAGQEVSSGDDFDRFFGGPTVRRLEKKLKEYKDEV